jgi:hypothetical protein
MHLIWFFLPKLMQQQGVVLPDGNATFNSAHQKANVESGRKSSSSDRDSH